MEVLLTLIFITAFIAGAIYIPYKIYKVIFVGENPSGTSSNTPTTDWKCPKCGLINNVQGSTSCFCGYDKNEHQVEIQGKGRDALNTNNINPDYAPPPTPNKIDDFDNLTQTALKSALFEKNFEVLGLSLNATIDEVRERCKELVKQWHPDLHKHDPEKHKVATQKVQNFKAAYEAIINNDSMSASKTIVSIVNKDIKTSASYSTVDAFNKINPNIYCFALLGGTISFISMIFMSKNVAILLCLAGAVGICWAWVYHLICLSRCWAIIQGTTARTSSGKAVGFLFIPFFNIYWTFIAYVGLASDANKYAESQRLNSRISYSLAVTACILLLIPYINLISIILFTVLTYQMASFHNEVINKWDVLTEHPDTTKANNVILIACLSVFSLFIIGILAAIAIPQFTAYRNRGYNSASTSDCINLKAALEVYYTDNQTYPNDLSLLSGRYNFVPSKDVDVQYNPACNQYFDNNTNIIVCDSYVIFTQHKQGDRNIASTNSDARILYKLKTEPDDAYKPL